MLHTQIVTDDDALLAMRPEWEELWRSANGRYQDSFEFCWLSRRHVAAPAGDGLQVVVVRDAGRAALIWPMSVRRARLLTFLQPLGPGAADETAVLIGAGAQDALAAGWQAVRRAPGADVVSLPYLPSGSALHALVTAGPGVVSAVPDFLPVAPLRGQPDWDGYRTGSARRSAGKRLRRLARLGAVTQRELIVGRDDDEFGRIVDWMLARKRSWANEAGKAGKAGRWLSSPGYRDFLVASLRDTEASDPLTRLFLLELDGRPVGAVTAGRGCTMAHAQFLAFDPAYAAFSPGGLALEQCGRWAAQAGLDLNLGPGGESFKLNLSRGEGFASSSLQVALTGRGRRAARTRDLARLAAELTRAGRDRLTPRRLART